MTTGAPPNSTPAPAPDAPRPVNTPASVGPVPAPAEARPRFVVDNDMVTDTLSGRDLTLTRAVDRMNDMDRILSTPQGALPTDAIPRLTAIARGYCSDRFGRDCAVCNLDAVGFAYAMPKTPDSHGQVYWGDVFAWHLMR